jgi:hypothetical protein
MFLWWGPELTCFYNDAYRPSLGINGKHPSILGMPAEKAWPEIWEIIEPLIDQVLPAGEQPGAKINSSLFSAMAGWKMCIGPLVTARSIMNPEMWQAYW